MHRITIVYIKCYITNKHVRHRITKYKAVAQGCSNHFSRENKPNIHHSQVSWSLTSLFSRNMAISETSTSQPKNLMMKFELWHWPTDFTQFKVNQHFKYQYLWTHAGPIAIAVPGPFKWRITINQSIHWCNWSIIFCDLAKNCFISIHVGLRHIGQQFSRRRLHATFSSRCDLMTSAMACNMNKYLTVIRMVKQCPKQWQCENTTNTLCLKKTFHLWLAINFTYTIRLQQFLAKIKCCEESRQSKYFPTSPK